MDGNDLRFRIMAKVEFIWPIARMRGSLSKESEVYFRVVNGRTYVCRKPKRHAGNV